MPSNKLVALWCWYHGAPFRGYQSQPQGPTVQDTLITALRSSGFERNPVAAGRTDLGVHARMQVLSLRVVESVPPPDIAARLNSVLPADVIGIACAAEAKPKFHAAWLASGKTYRYRLLATSADPDVRARWGQAAWAVDVDSGRLREVLAHFVGTHDFFAFHDKSSAAKPRTINSISVTEPTAGLVDIEFKGEGFARYMIRFIVGAAVAVARQEATEEQLRVALESQRPFGPAKAPAAGLILWEVHYPTQLDPFHAARRESLALPRVPPFAER